MSALVAATAIRGASGGVAAAAALAVALAQPARGVVLCEVGAGTQRRATLLCSPAARLLEQRLARLADDDAVHAVAARGTLCWVALPASPGWRKALEHCLDVGADAVVVSLEQSQWRELLDSHPLCPAGAVLRADMPRGRGLAALLAGELSARGLRIGVVTFAPGLVATRRALAGIDPGGALGRRTGRIAARIRSAPGLAAEAGQALPLVLALALALVVVGFALALLGSTATGAARLQQAADLAAVSAARQMRDDYDRLFEPRLLPSGASNPGHVSEDAYRRRAGAAARNAAAANGLKSADVAVSFPGTGFAGTRVRVALRAEPGFAKARGEPVHAVAVAEAHPTVSAGAAPMPGEPRASGGGYSGPLDYRQGKPMRPDVARAFDLIAAAAARAGHALTITSAFRSDAEQAALFAANPDPRWVAPPGTSLHRCATELDLGPPSAYEWLAQHATRYGFLKRYSWEPWHYGFVRGPAPCSTEADSLGRGAGDGQGARLGLPAFVPRRFRSPIIAAASRWNVSAGMLAAQLMAESGFNPYAVSPAGARGVAQFMPATAAAYGLDDPFDVPAAIDAQAHLMSDLLGRFGSLELALAAYNAGAGAVAACGCVPAYPETQAYVARILGLLGGSGELPPPALEVRLVR